MFVKILFLLFISNQVNSQLPISPCPSVLIYEENSGTGRWNAIINMYSEEQLKGIWLKITLDRSADLLGNTFGDATSKDNKEYLIINQNFLLHAEEIVPVKFFVKYNAANIIPSITEINLNGKTICSNYDRKTEKTTVRTTINGGSISNSIGLNNRPRTTSYRPTTTKGPMRPNRKPSTLNNRPTSSNNYNVDTDDYKIDTNRPITTSSNFNKPNNFNTHGQDEYTENLNNYNSNTDSFGNQREPPKDFSQQVDSTSINLEDNEDFFTGDFSAIVNRPQLNQSFSRPSILSRDQQCGTVALSPRPLISYGQNTSPGQWPWHAALYHSKGIQTVYTCGGTLISKKHIVTAAHCVTKPHTNRAINPQNMLVYLGKYSLQKFGEDIQAKEVSDIYVHPQYNHTVYFNDIAILRLADPAQITNTVRPACLWDEVTDLNEIEGRSGTVVGWGFDQNRQLSSTLMQAQMPVVSIATCLFSNREFFSQFTSEKSFCAGFRNGTSVCNGDSGGGMVFPKQGTSGSSTVWQLRGLVSVGVALQGQGVCDPSQYIVFTDVAKHLDWVQRILLSYP